MPLPTTTVSNPRWNSFVEIGNRRMEGSVGATFRAGVFAWGYCLPPKGSRPDIIIMTYIIALGEFSHVAAGSVDCAFKVLAGKAALADYAAYRPW